MKVKSLCLALAVLGLTATGAHAADGKLKFVGKIGSSTCQINGGQTTEIEVPMGTVPVERLQNNVDGPEVGFAINMTNCKPGTYYLVLDGTSPSGQQNVLALDNSATNAKGVGIKIKDIADKNVTLSKSLDFANDSSITITDADNGGGTFYLKANYFAYDKAALSTGDANATATFTVVQQ